ncbi:MAG TPA: DUF4388 domain-containing protein [Thermoanaerobaculia bacterium]
MSVSGNLRTMPLSEVLTWISLHHKRGTLLIWSERGVHKLAFDEGSLIFSAAPEGTENLGRLLIAKGVLTEEKHEHARRVRQETGVGLAKVLTDLQICREADIIELMTKKAESEIFELLPVTDGEFEFIGGDVPRFDMLPMRLEISEALLKIGQHVDEHGRYLFDTSPGRLALPEP